MPRIFKIFGWFLLFAYLTQMQVDQCVRASNNESYQSSKYYMQLAVLKNDLTIIQLRKELTEIMASKVKKINRPKQEKKSK